MATQGRWTKSRKYYVVLRVGINWDTDVGLDKEQVRELVKAKALDVLGKKRVKLYNPQYVAPDNVVALVYTTHNVIQSWGNDLVSHVRG